MPADIQTSDNQQQSSMDKMAATAQKSSGELGQTTPALTYASAAKGRSPSVPSLPPTGKIISEAFENGMKRSSSSGSRDAIANSAKRTASETRTPQVEGATAGEEQQPVHRHSVTKDVSKPDKTTEKAPSAAQPQAAVSVLSSPEYGTTSTSTLPKEDDAFSNVNGSSDSTWDKQSQTSQNGSKGGEKAEAEKEQATKISWDEDALAPVSLKEAPPPPVNIWQQRIAAQKPKQSTPPSTKPAVPNPIPGNSNGPAKCTEANPEQKKQDGKKKGKTGAGSPDERPALGGARSGVKSADAADKISSLPVLPPPPPGDATSWPSPERALNEGKKKAPERIEKDEKDTAQVPKPHKEKWVPMPLVHSVVFETPFPTARRGGKLPRGGREGGARGGSVANASNGAEKQTVPGAGTSNGQTPSTSGLERGRGALNPTPNNANLPKPKRASSAGPTTPRDQRRLGDSTATEKRKEFDNGLAKAGQSNGNNGNNGNSVKETRRPSVPMAAKDQQPEWSARIVSVDTAAASANSVQSNGDDGQKNLSSASEAPVSPRVGGPEQRSEGSIRSPDSAREFQGNSSFRDRGEGRPERGRGGYRGRGGPGHAAFYSSNLPNGHGYTNGQQSLHQPAPATPAKTYSNQESSPSHAQSSYYQSAQQYGKHHRSNSRSQSIPHSTPYGRYSSGHHSGPPHLANLRTDLANEYGYLPGNNGIMTAIPYNPYLEIDLFDMVSVQMEYYFSVDNLCKDMFLRKQMDSQGFVFLAVLAKFNRIKQLTTSYATIQQVCLNSRLIEYYDPRVDGIDRVRKRDGWQQWVMKIEERDPSAQNDGPPLRPQYPSMHDAHHPFDEASAISPRSSAVANSVENFQFQSLDSIAPPYSQASPMGVPNGADASTHRAPLSAAVSEFSPSVLSSNPRSFSQPDPQIPGSSVFTDEQVDNLNIVVRKPVHATTPTRPHFHSSSSRTFSNGSIDGRSINEDLSKLTDRQPGTAMNGDTPDRIQRTRSPFSVVSSGRQIDNNVSPPVLWIKDRQTAITTLDTLPNDCAAESYHDFRRDALKQREQPAADKAHYHDNMQSLYQFWSHFLIRNFNVHMYEEFRQLALEDASQRGSTTGLRNLLQYYDESILSQKTISDDKIARDFIDLVRLETNSKERPAFSKLRAVWRNGAYNMKNRSKLSKFLDPDLKSELDR